MTFREKLKLMHPAEVGDEFMGGCYGCPVTFGFEADYPEHCRGDYGILRWASGLSDVLLCRACWDREVPEEDNGR